MSVTRVPFDQPLDELLWRHYGHLDNDLVARVLDIPFNRTLANWLVLPQGTLVDMPDESTLTARPQTDVSFW